METSSKKNRVVYFDILNILATISVVWIHFGNEVHWYDGSTVWYWCLLIQVICYWAVPVFFMLTGATLMGYRKRCSTKEYFIHRLKRGLAPYLVFGTLLTLVCLKKGTLTIDPAHPVLWVLDVFMNNRMEHIYWFFVVLLGIYLTIPALSVFAREENRKELNYMVALGTLTICVFPFLNQMLSQYLGVTENCWNSALSFPMLGGYLIYPVLGYWASVHDFTPRQRIMCYAAAVLCGVLRYSGLAQLSVRDGATNQLYMDYVSFPALFLALGVFVFVRYLFSEHVTMSEPVKKILKECSACSLGVYLIHNPVLGRMAAIPFFAKYSFQWYFFWPFVCYVACALAVFTARACLKRFTSLVGGVVRAKGGSRGQA